MSWCINDREGVPRFIIDQRGLCFSCDPDAPPLFRREGPLKPPLCGLQKIGRRALLFDASVEIFEAGYGGDQVRYVCWRGQEYWEPHRLEQTAPIDSQLLSWIAGYRRGCRKEAFGVLA